VGAANREDGSGVIVKLLFPVVPAVAG